MRHKLSAVFSARTSRGGYEIDMCSGPILRKMLLFAVPLMCSSVLQLLFNAADIVVVGRFAGDNSLAAVGSTTALINLLTNLFIGLSIGSNVLAAREYGARQGRELGRTVHTSMLLSVLSGLLLTAVGVPGARYILAWMQTPPEVLGLATLYLRIYFLGMTATMVYNFGSAVLRAVGDTRRPLYYLMAAGVVNVVLNLFFVIVLHLDVAGVAIATVISQTISAALVVRCLMRETGWIRLELRRLRIERDKLAAILRVGLPAGFQGIVFALSNVVIQASVNTFGPVVMAGNSAAANIEGFVYVAMNAFYQATLSFTSQNMGAGNYRRISRILLTGQLCAITAGLVLGNLAVLLGHGLLSVYSRSEPVIQAGMVRLHVIARTYALCGIMDVMVGALRGMGYSLLPMFVSLLGACGLRLVWLATVFQIPRFHTAPVIYASYPISWLATLSVHVVCYLWARRQLPKETTPAA
jgi:putative MATE family efflux protein